MHDIDEVFESIELSNNEDIPVGSYTGTIAFTEVGPGKPDWINKQLSVRVRDGEGRSAWGNILLDPLSNRDGELSKGRLRFLKWQLTALGYDGRLSELDARAYELVGNTVEFEVKNTDRINPNTGMPYTEVVFKKLVERSVVEDGEFTPV